MTLHRKVRLFWGIALAVVPPVVLGVAGIVRLQYAKTRQELLRAVNAQMVQLARQAAAGLDENLGERERDARALTESPLIADYYHNLEFGLLDEARSSRRELGAFLRRYLSRNQGYARAVYLDERGREVAGAVAPGEEQAMDFSREDFVRALAINGGGPLPTRPGSPLLWFARPVRDELGRVRGVVALAEDLKRLHVRLARVEVGRRGGARLIMPEGQNVLGRVPAVAGEALAASAELPHHPGWRVVAEAPREDFLKPLDSIARVALATSLAGLVFLVGLLLWLARRIARPIEELAQAASEIGDGRLERRVSAAGGDEIAALARAFNAMAERLERQRREQAELQSQLIQSEKLSAIGQMISSVAHELNNPLGAITGYAQMLAQDDIPAIAAEDLEHIRVNVERCRKIVDNLLFFARKNRVERKRVDLNAALKASSELLSYRLSKIEGVTVVEELDTRTPPIRGDFQQIVQVLVNLMGNACDAMEGQRRPEGKRLILRTRAALDRALVEIEDNGSGIDPRSLEKIFEPFYTTKEPGKGTGLGLPICRQIAREHGGDVRVESRLGRGTVFRLDFPPFVDAPDSPDGPDREPDAEEFAPVPGRRVLVAEDEASIAKLVARVLRDDGDEVDVAGDGAQALSLLSANSYDLVISDVEMEHAKGPELHAALARDSKSTPMLFITGDMLNPKVLEFLAKSGCPFLPKPFGLVELRRETRRLLGRGAPR